MSVFRFANHYALKNNLIIINKYLVKYSTPSSFGSSKAIFLLTESHFLLFEQNKNKLIFISPWKNINAISVEESKLSLSFTFVNRNKIDTSEYIENKQFTMWSLRSDLKSAEIKSKIIVLLQRVLSKTEQHNLKIKNLNEPIYYPTPRSPIARFRMWDVLNDPSFNFDMSTFTEVHKKLVYSLVFRDNNLQLSSFPQSEKMLPVYLDMLKVAPQVQQLRIPMVPAKKTYDYINDLLVNNDYLQYVEISGKCNKEFFYLIKAIKDNKNSRISSLSFVNTQFTINELSLLYDFVVNGSNINALEFHSSISSEAIDYFYSSFLTPVLCEKLAILNLNQSPGINTEKLFPKITNISMLSLEGCDIELGDVFNCIAQGTAIGLRELNISRCYVKSVPDENLPQFNRNFQKLIINEVSWPSGTLVPFFQFFFSHFHLSSSDNHDEFGPSLYFSNEIAETDEWLSLFDYLGTVDRYHDLVKLGWNGNPVHQSLFNFLKKNIHLSTLMMSCCFSEESPESINYLCQFISSSNSFTTLVISGNEINHFGKYTNDVIRSLSNHPSLKELDISFSYGGDDTVASILPFIQNCQQLEMIDFDAVFCQRTNALLDLMRNLNLKKDQIQISFPTYEFTRIKNNKMITKDFFDEITHLFKIPICPDFAHPIELQNQLQINVNDENAKNNAKKQKKKKNDEEDDDLPNIPPSQILAKNYCIYKHYNPPDFPCVISKEMFDEIRKQTRQQKSITMSSPRRENSIKTRSVFGKVNSPNRNASNNDINDDIDNDKIWPRSQAEIVETRNNLRSISKNEPTTPESTKSPKSLDVFEEEQSPKKVRQSNSGAKIGKRNPRVLRRKGKRQSKPKKQLYSENEEEEGDDYNNSNNIKLGSSNKNNNIRRSNNKLSKKTKPRANKTKRKLRKSNVSNNDDNLDEYDDDNNNHDNYIKTPKDIKPLFEHSKQFEEDDFERSIPVSLTESTDEEDDFVFEDKRVPTKPEKSINSEKNTPKKQSPKKRLTTGKKAKNTVKKKKQQPKVSKEDSNEYNNYYDNDDSIDKLSEYSDTQSDGYNENNNNKNSEDSNDIFDKSNSNNKKFNTRKPTKGYPVQKPKDNEKLNKSHPGKIKKNLIPRENNYKDDDAEQINDIKDRDIPENYQIDEIDDYNDNDVDNNDDDNNDDDNNDDDNNVFNSQIFDEQMPKIDKYENSASWQQYDQEFALNTLFSKIKYNKSE